MRTLQWVSCQVPHQQSTHKSDLLIGTNVPSLLDRCEAWHYVMQWAKGELEFVALTKKLEGLGGYNLADWQVLFRDLFDLSEDDNVLGSIAKVEEAMWAHGIFLANPSANTSQQISGEL